jgi:WD40 repeat protein
LLLRELHFVCFYQAHTSTIWGICFKPAGKQAGKLLASCSDDENIIIWERKEVGEKAKWENVCTLTGYHSRCIFSVDWSSQGVLASAGADDTICLFRESPESPNLEGKRVFVRCSTKERAHSTDINCVSWHPSGGMLASACDDGTIKIWKFAPFAEY